jgi:3-isopropylmalate/(R)-2-methylmalate dehydratase small subunit
MEPFAAHTGRGLPLRRSKVDTDQILPAEYMKLVTRSGYGRYLFASWREDPGFVLNQPGYAGATILVAGTDFGIGSSREHAVWALRDHGFRVVISARFGDIFRANAGNVGLLAVSMPDEAVSRLQDEIEADPSTPVTVDLDRRSVTVADRDPGARWSVGFAIDDYSRWRLMAGLDDISLAIQHDGEITAYEARRSPWMPTAG